MQSYQNAKKLQKLTYPTPIITNAHHNREMAIKCNKAGKTVQQIADHYPEVFFTDSEGKLGQKYDSIYTDTQLHETKYMITDVSVISFIGNATKYREGVRKDA